VSKRGERDEKAKARKKRGIEMKSAKGANPNGHFSVRNRGRRGFAAPGQCPFDGSFTKKIGSASRVGLESQL